MSRPLRVLLADDERPARRFLARLLASFPDVEIVLAGMRMPPNLGRDYTRAFERVYADLAAEKSVHLIPFLLEGVGGIPDLNQGDGIHPTAAGHEIIARTVWEHLEPVLAKMQSTSEAT